MKNSVHKKIKYTVAVFLVWLFIHAAYITYDGLHPYQGSADVAIILGNVVYADSSLSPWLQGRVDKAIELYKTGRVQQIFASGGQGEFKVREGDAMKRYLLLKNIPSSAIVTDNDGVNTYHTAKDFMALDASAHFSSAIVVTSFYHITRSKYIIRKQGFKNIYGVASDVYFIQDGYGLWREFFAFYKYMIFY